MGSSLQPAKHLPLPNNAVPPTVKQVGGASPQAVEPATTISFRTSDQPIYAR